MFMILEEDFRKRSFKNGEKVGFSLKEDQFQSVDEMGVKASCERDVEKQGGRGNDDKNCDVDIRGEKRHSDGDIVKTGDGGA
uniref:Uncharacterized protein n=1 Tax=Solanum lycopersicum TaxID=4081 RepID=A0A3Q7JI39_SOLLC